MGLEPITTASVLVGGEEFRATSEAPLLFGRADNAGTIGLDAADMGISGVACSVEFAWAVWWVVNQSTKRPLFIEHPGGPASHALAPGHRYAIMTAQLNVLIAGAIYTHVLEIVPGPEYVDGLCGDRGRLTTGTLKGPSVTLSDRERDALSALCAGYLESFPRRREHPNTYDQAAGLLDPTSWSGDRVRKAVERVKLRFRTKHGLYFEGPQANYELAAYLVLSGILTGADLARLPGRRP